MVRMFSGGLTSPVEVMRRLDEILAAPPRPERSTWGTGPAAERAHRAMLDRVGGPAPIRKERDR